MTGFQYTIEITDHETGEVKLVQCDAIVLSFGLIEERDPSKNRRVLKGGVFIEGNESACVALFAQLRSDSALAGGRALSNRLTMG